MNDRWKLVLADRDGYFPGVLCTCNGSPFVMKSRELVQDPRLGTYLVKILHFLTVL